jgi:hypothetical protein
VLKILVTTLESGEAEIQECIASIRSQKSVSIEHQLISGLGERDAHKQLATSWNKRKKEFDFFSKVDADTILLSDKSLFSMASLMQKEKATGIQVKLLDYFSNQLISGVNMFSNEVLFKERPPRLKPDHLDYNHRKVLKGEAVIFLEPIGLHGKFPNSQQSFFYGYRRFLKGQVSILRSCFEEWGGARDEARRWALIGAISASSNRSNKVLFSSRRVHKKFQRTTRESYSDKQLIDFATTKLYLR